MLTIRSAFLVAVFLGITFSGCGKDEPTGPGGTGGPVAINGRVLSRLLVPVPNIPVMVIGKPPVSTDASGRFSIPGVTPPYTIVAVNVAELQVYVFEDVTRTDPTLTYLTAFDTPRYASFGGLLHGGTYPQNGNPVTVVGFESPEAGSSFAGATDSVFTVGFSWYGPTSVSGTVYALQWQGGAAGLPLTYTGYGSIANVALTDGGSVSGAIINLSVPGDTTASGTVIIPSGYTLQSQWFGLRFGQKLALDIGGYLSPPPSFNFTVPRTVGTPYLQFVASATGSQVTYWKTLSRGPGNAITIPQGIYLELPPNAAANVDTGTVFSWTPFDGAVYRANFLSPSPTSPDYMILTGRTSASIPDLASIGFGLPDSVSYSWGVYAYSPVAGIDGGTGPEGYYSVSSPPADGGYSATINRSFTTRP